MMDDPPSAPAVVSHGRFDPSRGRPADSRGGDKPLQQLGSQTDGPPSPSVEYHALAPRPRPPKPGHLDQLAEHRPGDDPVRARPDRHHRDRVPAGRGRRSRRHDRARPRRSCSQREHELASRPTPPEGSKLLRRPRPGTFTDGRHRVRGMGSDRTGPVEARSAQSGLIRQATSPSASASANASSNDSGIVWASIPPAHRSYSAREMNAFPYGQTRR